MFAEEVSVYTAWIFIWLFVVYLIKWKFVNRFTNYAHCAQCTRSLSPLCHKWYSFALHLIASSDRQECNLIPMTDEKNIRLIHYMFLIPPAFGKTVTNQDLQSVISFSIIILLRQTWAHSVKKKIQVAHPEEIRTHILFQRKIISNDGLWIIKWFFIFFTTCHDLKEILLYFFFGY